MPISKDRSVWNVCRIAMVSLVAGLALWLALPVRPELASASSESLKPMVIQGRVTDVQKNSITVRTPDIRPTYESGKPMPMFIIAGETFKADISQAAFESPIGLPGDHNDLKIGDGVVVVCDPIAMTANSSRPWDVTAIVVEKLIMPLGR